MEDAKTSTGNADGDDDAERIELARGASDVELYIELAPGETKKFVAYVKKGYMTCIRTDKDFGAQLTIQAGGFFANSENGPCSEHQDKAGDMPIWFVNNGSKKLKFTATVGFHQHG